MRKKLLKESGIVKSAKKKRDKGVNLYRRRIVHENQRRFLKIDSIVEFGGLKRLRGSQVDGGNDKTKADLVEAPEKRTAAYNSFTSPKRKDFCFPSQTYALGQLPAARSANNQRAIEQQLGRSSRRKESSEVVTPKYKSN